MKNRLTIRLFTSLLLLSAAASLRAATITVTNTNDALSGSLRQAIQDAHPNDTVVFNIPTSDPGYDALTGVYTINLTSAGLTIDKTLVIYGVLNGVVSKIVVRRNAGNSFSIFSVTSGTFVIIENLTISNGSATTGFGGGIFNEGLLFLDDCTFSGNEASSGGGGLYNNGSATVRHCTFTANEGDVGGAILNAGTLMLNESTLSGNDGSSNSGGIYSALGASTYARSTVVAGNSGSSSEPDVFGIFISDGYNFIGVGGGSTGFGNPGSHDQVGTVANPADPKLGPLGDHGGSTSTMAPLLGSLVIDQGKRETDVDGVPVSELDQRGFPRPTDQADVVDAAEGDGSDIGAVELSEFQTGPDYTVTTTDDHDDAACGPEDCTLREALSAPDVSGTFVSQGSNVIGHTTGATGFDVAGGDQVGVDPNVGIFGNHGGLTDTIPLLAGSVAINQADAATAPERDQRGYVREDSPDVGAFEFAGTIPVALANISTRLSVGTGDNVLIGGFIVTGTEAKKVIVRAIGPSLPLANKLANPTLELYDASGWIISDDDWKSTQQMEVEATGLQPPNELESAIVATLPANAAYTAIVRGVNNTTGVGLIEVYDLDRTVDSKLANISTRGLVQTGDNVMIGGLIVLGADPQNVIVRAIGPSLPLTGKLSDPSLELHDGNGALGVANDNWRSDQEAEITATGIPPANDAESAIVRILTPAAYTAIVRGANGTTGITLVEAYALADGD